MISKREWRDEGGALVGICLFQNVGGYPGVMYWMEVTVTTSILGIFTSDWYLLLVVLRHYCMYAKCVVGDVAM